MPANPVRAAAYYRMSKDEQEHSIERQEGQVNPYAAAKGYAVVKVYKDEFLHHIHNKSCTVKPGGYSSANPDLGKMAAD